MSRARCHRWPQVAWPEVIRESIFLPIFTKGRPEADISVSLPGGPTALRSECRVGETQLNVAEALHAAVCLKNEGIGITGAKGIHTVEGALCDIVPERNCGS